MLRLDELVEANQRLVEANERLEARVAELERRLSRSSRNPSLPPSQDPPSAPPRPRGKGSGRNRGGQHGHEGRDRRLVPPEQVDEIVEHWPERCGSCAHEFAEADRVDAAEPVRRQLAELPSIAVKVAEHRLHRVCCPECAAVSAAEAPAGSRWSFGPRLQAAVVTLAVRNHVSRRDTTELARELLVADASISPKSASNPSNAAAASPTICSANACAPACDSRCSRSSVTASRASSRSCCRYSSGSSHAEPRLAVLLEPGVRVDLLAALLVVHLAQALLPG